MKRLEIDSINAEQFKELLAQTVAAELLKISDKLLAPVAQEKYLSKNEVAEMFQVDLSTIWRWSKPGGVLKPYGISGRIYYLLSDVQAALIPINQ